MPSSYGFLSTYPPTQCGLATFTAALMRGLATPESGDRAGVVSVVDTPASSRAPEVVGYLQTRAPGGHRVAAEALNRFDVAVIQHEYGIFGGQDGDQVLAVLDEVQVPIVVVAHTVLAGPTPHQRHVLEQVVSASGAVVTMTEAARDRLVAGYDVDPAKVVVIPHGATRPRWRSHADTGEKTADPDVGTTRPGQGHRMGDRRPAAPPTPAPPARVHRCRSDAPPGTAAPW